MSRALGITGTRHGMTEEQREMVRIWVLLQDGLTEFHHGDCIGVDDDVNRMVTDAFGAAVTRHAWPMEGAGTRRANSPSDVVHGELPPLVRNRKIVEHAHLMIAAPQEFEKVMRSGTWATIRYAREGKVPLVIVWPDGNVSIEIGEIAVDTRRSEP